MRYSADYLRSNPREVVWRLVATDLMEIFQDFIKKSHRKGMLKDEGRALAILDAIKIDMNTSFFDF